MITYLTNFGSPIFGSTSWCLDKVQEEWKLFVALCHVKFKLSLAFSWSNTFSIFILVGINVYHVLPSLAIRWSVFSKLRYDKVLT